MLENMTRVEAMACVRKYFVVASVARGCFGFEISGSRHRVFSSSPSHAISQW